MQCEFAAGDRIGVTIIVLLALLQLLSSFPSLEPGTGFKAAV
jgi:hypothetical protein